VKWQQAYPGSKDLIPIRGQPADISQINSLIDTFDRDSEGLSPSPGSLIKKLRGWADELEQGGTGYLPYSTYARLLRWCITDWTKGSNVNYDMAQQSARRLWTALFGPALPRFRQWIPSQKRYYDDEEDWARWYSRISAPTDQSISE
jgi:hypothetical protein